MSINERRRRGEGRRWDSFGHRIQKSFEPIDISDGFLSIERWARWWCVRKRGGETDGSIDSNAFQYVLASIAFYQYLKSIQRMENATNRMPMCKCWFDWINYSWSEPNDQFTVDVNTMNGGHDNSCTHPVRSPFVTLIFPTVPTAAIDTIEREFEPVRSRSSHHSTLLLQEFRSAHRTFPIHSYMVIHKHT